jgi:hypothetical protein
VGTGDVKEETEGVDEAGVGLVDVGVEEGLLEEGLLEEGLFEVGVGGDAFVDVGVEAAFEVGVGVTGPEMGEAPEGFVTVDVAVVGTGEATGIGNTSTSSFWIGALPPGLYVKNRASWLMSLIIREKAKAPGTTLIRRET